MSKKLVERLNDVRDEMTGIINAAKEEERTLTDEENAKFDALEKEATEIKATIEREDKVKDMEKLEKIDVTGAPVDEVKTFADYIRSQVTGAPMDADSNITKGDNGAIIPKTIAQKIVQRIEEISPIYASAEKFNVKGELVIPYLDAANDGISMAYAEEFTDLESKSAKLTGITLSGYLAGVLTKVSRSLINNSDFDVVGFVSEKIAQAVAKFVEHEALIGTDGKATGLSTATQIVTAAAADAITADELIDVQDKIPSAYQAGAYWIMNKSTLNAIRKLKDGDGRYLLNPDIREGFGYTLLGSPVYTSDSMPEIATGAKAVYYGDYTQGLAIKLVEDFQLQVLNEKFATQHATGLVGWTEFDCKVQNDQAVAVLKMA